MRGRSSKQSVRAVFSSVGLACLLMVFGLVGGATPVSAASTSIVGRTNGADCNSGGTFTPSAVTITSGDTVTISVPVNDPYSGGIEVHGFPQGSFVVARGGSVTTAAITANVSYYGTWPSSGCMKGTGTITVSAPASTPLANSSGSAASSSGSSSVSSSSPAGAAKTTPAAPTPKSSTTPATPTTQTAPTDATSRPATTSQSKDEAATRKATTSDAPQSPKSKRVAIIGGGGIVIIAAVATICWRLLTRRRLATPTSTAVPDGQMVQPQPTDETRHDDLQ